MEQPATSLGARPQPVWGRLAQVGRAVQAPILVAGAYYLGAEAAFSIGTLSDRIFAPFWPPNVVLFCALLLASERRWWVFIAAAFPAHVAAELGVGMPAWQLLVAFATNCMVALLNAAAVRRVLGGPPWFGSLRKTCLYILITAIASPAVVAFGGAFVPILGGGSVEQYWVFWTQWYVANALPHLTLGPVFLSWLSESPTSSALTRPRRKAEAAVLGIALVVVCSIAFEVSARTVASGFLPALLYLPLPLILWAAVRFGEKGASGAILVVTVVLIWRTLNSPSIFIGGDPETNVLAVQLFLTGLSIPVLLLGAAIDELRHAEQTTRELAGSILAARDEERRRIARELHDSTGQNLVVANMLAGRLRKALPESAAATIDHLDELLQQSIRELRTVSYLLHPPLLDEAGLELALRHYVDGFSERSGLAVDLCVCPDLERLSNEVELALFRVVQEALTNVSRHSGSATARIELTRGMVMGRESVILTIEDAGRGMPELVGLPGRVAQRLRSIGGVGLAGMRERLRQIGGRLEIDSATGKTIVTAIVPVGHKSAVANP